MKLIQHESDDAAVALAIDDALLHQGGFYLSTRTNSPCVSIGLNQDAAAEVNLTAAKRLGVPVVRRKTGGGAVYRDGGCIAFSFIVPSVHRNEFIETLVQALAMLGIKVEKTGHNDLFWRERKVSGLAWSEFEDRVLIHGSILFSTNLEIMSLMLDGGKAKYQGTSIASVRSRVTNLQTAFPDMHAETFRELLQASLVSILRKNRIVIRCGTVPEEVKMIAKERAESYHIQP
ncbi:MAG: lipoate--protein ligase family protein [Eggerthellaceae bacterium]|jgi:lipoyltransferase/lipoate-protein ligase|nr:lipoate--protein ligase family protein [Eggerthellaceae bacterium]